MKKNNSKFCHTNYYLIDEDSKFYGLIKVKKELSYSKLMNSCDIGLSTVLLERKLLLNCKFPNLKTKSRVGALNVAFEEARAFKGEFTQGIEHHDHSYTKQGMILEVPFGN